MNVFCRIFSRKFRKMRFFLAEKNVSDVFRPSRKASVNFCKPTIRIKKSFFGGLLAGLGRISGP